MARRIQVLLSIGFGLAVLAGCADSESQSAAISSNQPEETASEPDELPPVAPSESQDGRTGDLADSEGSEVTSTTTTEPLVTTIDDQDESSSPTTSIETPVEEALPPQDNPDASSGAPTPLELRDGLIVTLENIEPGGDEEGPWLTVDIHVANTGDDAATPEVGIICAGSPEVGFLHDGSSYEEYLPLPTGTSSTGFGRMRLPGDFRLGDPIPECNTPAAIRVTHWGNTQDQILRRFDAEGTDTAVFPIADEVIEALAN